MKRYKIAGICLSLAIAAVLPAMPTAAAQIGSVSPVEVWGNLKNKTGTSWTVENQNPGGYEGEFIEHISEDTKLLDTETGMPVPEAEVEEGSLVYAYTKAAVTASIPPQSEALLCLTNIPGGVSIPDYVKALEIEKMLQTGWKLEGGRAGTPDAVWVYYKEVGNKHFGWLEDAGKWYYLNPETGMMERGFIQIDGKTYYLLEDGSLLTESRVFVPDQNGVLR